MLNLENITKSFGSRKIIRQCSYVIPENTILALIGPNGTGKTTLLKMICGQEPLDEGRIIPKKDKVIGYLPQEPNPTPQDTILKECCAGNAFIFDLQHNLAKLEEELGSNYSEEVLEAFENAERLYRESGGYSFENDVKKVLLGLGFNQEQFDKSPLILSGGQRMRLEMGRLLVRNVDLLILDEPTNHLDLPSIEWLEEYLQEFKGTVLFVSHDEAVLNQLPDRILALEGGFLKEYVGNYDDYLEQKTEIEENREKNKKNIEKKIKQLSKFVDRFKAKASLAKQAQNKLKTIDKLNHQIQELGPGIIEPEVNIKMAISQQSSKNVLSFDGAIGYAHNVLLPKVSVSITRGQKIAMIGANGLGKSTLIKSIMGEIEPISGKIEFGQNVTIGYYAQEQTKNLDENKSVIENMKQVNPGIAENKLLRLLGSFLFKKDDIHKPVRVLSGGEKSRLSLASMLAQDLNFLILDEPTNHLDIISSQILANALKEFEGTVLFVSHNRTFIDSAATYLMIFENKDIRMETRI